MEQKRAQKRTKGMMTTDNRLRFFLETEPGWAKDSVTIAAQGDQALMAYLTRFSGDVLANGPKELEPLASVLEVVVTRWARASRGS